MLHAGLTPTFAHCVIEHVVGARRPECRYVTETKAPNRFARKLELGDRNEV
jgi:hypothetical protein